jgi:carbon storage regulator CsrA
MLVLARKLKERVVLTLEDGQEIWIEVTDIDRNKVRFGIRAPKGVVIDREEVYREKRGIV